MDQSFAGVRPFAFDTEFENAPVIPEVELDEHLSAAVLKAEIKAMRANRAREIAEAHARGLAEGRATARAERDEALLSAMDALHAAWEESEDAREAYRASYRTEAAQLALAIGEHLAGHALDIAPGAAVDAAIGRVLAVVERGQAVQVHVHPGLAPDLEARIAARQAGDRRQLNLTVIADDDIAPGDAQLSWPGGGLRIDAAERRQAVRDEMAPLLPHDI